MLEKWSAVAMEGLGTELVTLAETTQDALEEELARVVWQIELQRRKREYDDAGREGFEEVARYALLSDTLLAAYCVLVSAPEDIFGIAEGDYSNDMKRYSMMGALLVAQDAADAEMKQAKAKLRA